MVQLLGFVHISHCSSLQFLLSLHQSPLISSINLLYLFLPLPSSPTLVPSVFLSHILRDPHFTIVAPPLLSSWPLLYAKQVSARTRRTATNSQRRRQGLWGKKHTLTYTPTCSLFLCPLLCALSIYMHMHFTHMCSLSFSHTFTQTHIQLPWAGLGLGTARAEAVCLSLVFQQEAPGPARHLSGAAAADKEEAINPRKITSTDTLSHRNTAMQPHSFHLQCRQRKKEGKRRQRDLCELTLWMERHTESQLPLLTLVI